MRNSHFVHEHADSHMSAPPPWAMRDIPGIHRVPHASQGQPAHHPPVLVIEDEDDDEEEIGEVQSSGRPYVQPAKSKWDVFLEQPSTPCAVVIKPIAHPRPIVCVCLVPAFTFLTDVRFRLRQHHPHSLPKPRHTFSPSLLSHLRRPHDLSISLPQSWDELESQQRKLLPNLPSLPSLLHLPFQQCQN